MGQADAIVCSPPYADTAQPFHGDKPEAVLRAWWESYRQAGGGYGYAKFAESVRNGRRTAVGVYGTADGQVGALKPGPCPGVEADVGDDVETLTWGGCYKDSWKGLIVPEAFAHPAKVARGLAVRLFDHGFERGWWTKGSLVVDPFMGICGFGVVAAYKGLRFVGVELEERFHSLCLENVALHRRRWEGGGDVPPVCLRGDSRNFAALVAGAAACVTSPPYAGLALTVSESSRPEAKVARLLAEGKYREAEVIRQHGSGEHSNLRQQDYGTTRGQLGALPQGDADGVITSPPYADVQETRAPAAAEARRERCRKHEAGRGRDPDSPAGLPQGTYGTTPGQLGALPQGDADGVITSPPYAEGCAQRGGADLHPEHVQGSKRGVVLRDYGSTPGNVGNLAAGDADGVVTSPPWEDSIGDAAGRDPAATKVVRLNPPPPPAELAAYLKAARIARGLSLKEVCAAGGFHGEVNHGGAVSNWEAGLNVPTAEQWAKLKDILGLDCRYDSALLEVAEVPTTGHLATDGTGHARMESYGTAPGQVGALRQETYWEAVRCIYGQCLLALKPGGVACVVVKAFVRKGAVVDLPGQTWRLLLSLGFTPVERVRCLLAEETREPSLFGGCEVKKRSRQSFFRRLATKKGAPDIPYEEILVVRRRAAGVPG